MKINNIEITREEQINLTSAINYALRNHGTMQVEEQVFYASHSRDITVLVYVEQGWNKAFNLTTGAVTNLAEENTGDTDGDDTSILTRLEKIVDRIEAINRLLNRYEDLVASLDKLL